MRQAFVGDGRRGSDKRRCVQAMFGHTSSYNSELSALSEYNKLLIHASFVAQAPSAWGYNWLPGGFPDKSSLQRALSEWCTNATEAQATYGPVSTWDVSRVTEMTRLTSSYVDTGPYGEMRNCPCRSTFDEDVNAWDVSRVTDMRVRRRLFWGLGTA